MARILVCDDESGLRTVIRRYAEFEGHIVTEAENGRQAVECCKVQDFDLILMDVMMPELDGFSAIKEIRTHTQTPVLMLSARGEEYDKILGFELGVDDYVVKPFSSKELMMRVAAILRRTGAQSGVWQSDGRVIFEKDQLQVDLTAHKVLIAGKEVSMPPKAYDLLFFLIRNKNIAVPRERILTEVWGYDYFGDDRTLDTHMKLLRRALGEYGSLIVTLRGLGYRFEDA